jgi:hypothetical protein
MVEREVEKCRREFSKENLWRMIDGLFIWIMVIVLHVYIFIVIKGL